MKKKYGVNLVFFGIIATLFLIISCNKPVNKPEQGQLIKADREFSQLSLREGMHKAFLEFIADSGVMLRDKAYPLIGREALSKTFESRSDSAFTLAWEPVFECISSGGDLGYTYGYYTRTIKASGEVSRGTYLTIWQKQPDGKWKFLMDTGTQGLPDKSE